MQNTCLIRNARIYAPQDKGIADIFVAGGKIIAIGEGLKVDLPGLEVIDAAGAAVVPGFIDQHIHVTGGGGEGGWASRCPELLFSELAEAGVTTFVGVSGTDSMSRSIENLLAKVRGLKTEGASGFMWTSNYAYPVETITRDVKTEMFAIPEVIGVKIAMGDHRCSFPTNDEVLRVLSQIRVSGMLTGKVGFLHVHLGNDARAFDAFDYCVDAGIPIKHIRPTHVGRHPEVFKRACEFAKKGGFMDITTSGGNYMGDAYDAVKAALADGVPMDHITASSDAHGSIPRFNDAGEMIGLGTCSLDGNLVMFKKLAADIGIEQALMPLTKSIADALNLATKGVIEEGRDADLLFLDADNNITDVFMMGRRVKKYGKVVVKGLFEV